MTSAGEAMGSGSQAGAIIGQNWAVRCPDCGHPTRDSHPTLLREASLNWLALGLLLAAWNAADNGADERRRRPETLRGYSYVSVRAATRAGVATRVSAAVDR